MENGNQYGKFLREIHQNREIVDIRVGGENKKYHLSRVRCGTYDNAITFKMGTKELLPFEQRSLEFFLGRDIGEIEVLELGGYTCPVCCPTSTFIKYKDRETNEISTLRVDFKSFESENDPKYKKFFKSGVEDNMLLVGKNSTYQMLKDFPGKSASLEQVTSA
ncbi:MAG: hypothetical protein ABIF18_02035 [archaeon]